MQIELRALHEKLGMTTVYVTHDQREALTMSDRIAVINHGRLMQLDEPRRLYERPVNRFVADFIGESTFLPVTVSDGRAHYRGRPLHVSEPPDGAASYHLMLRPERLHVMTAGGQANVDDAEDNVFEGRITNIVYQGESLLMQVDLGDGVEVSVRGVTRRDAMAALPEVGGEVALGLHRDDTVLIADTEP